MKMKPTCDTTCTELRHQLRNSDRPTFTSYQQRLNVGPDSVCRKVWWNDELNQHRAAHWNVVECSSRGLRLEGVGSRAASWQSEDSMLLKPKESEIKSVCSQKDNIGVFKRDERVLLIGGKGRNIASHMTQKGLIKVTRPLPVISYLISQSLRSYWRNTFYVM